MLGIVTLDEAFIGKIPDMSRFHIFGCLAYYHVPLYKRSKLEPTLDKGIFMGYNKTTKAFRLYIPALRNAFIKRDVKFEVERALRNSLECDNDTA